VWRDIYHLLSTLFGKEVAQDVGREEDDIHSSHRLAEGVFNRTFEVTVKDDVQAVSRLRYPCTHPSVMRLLTR
jgi:hypothetical protein